MAPLPPTTTISPTLSPQAQHLLDSVRKTLSSHAIVASAFPHLSSYLCDFLVEVVHPMLIPQDTVLMEDEDAYLTSCIRGHRAKTDDPTDYLEDIQESVRANPISDLRESISEMKLTMATELTTMKATLAHLTTPPPAPPPSKPSAPSKPTPTPTAKLPTPKAPVPLAQAPPKPSAQPPSFASAAKVPTRPSLVLTPAPPTGPSPSLAVRKTPSEICEHLNDVLSGIHPGSSLLAARWTKNNNLVIVAGPDTTSHHLQQASAALTTAISHFISANPSSPIPITAKENVHWSHLLVNNIPTGASSLCGAYSPSECHDALARENPAYRALRLTRLPSWVRKPDSYPAGSSSSLVLSFEDPSGDTLRSLLQQKRLYAFGNVGELRPWKQKPRAHAPTPTA
ncbi:hypothetical protein EDB83DRAFT_2532021 [Lactarius deliciosus]|nr:hypothetical protein EDB83DRAFT_2532021 [Lactarius deliciosus]